jgi:hypothetical protein
MMEALLERNPASARERLSRLGPHARFPFYPRLAEAAVLHAEGRGREAADALAAWQRAVDATGLEVQLRVGNQWALERILSEASNLGPAGRAGRTE